MVTVFISLVTKPHDPLRTTEPSYQGPKKDISISILEGYPYLVGLHYKGGYMGYPYPNVCLCACLGPYLSGLGLGIQGLGYGNLPKP